jgi:surface antigen
MFRKWTVLLAITVIAAAWTPPADANGRGKQKKHEREEWHERHDDDRDDRGRKRKVKHKVTYAKGVPPWAPAHGYRFQHSHRERERVVVIRPEAAPVRPYVPPFGIDRGRCIRRDVGAVLGGATGGILGANVGRGTGRTAAIIGGTVIGILVGGSIGERLDELDQACIGQVLEHGPTGRPVQWQNPDLGSTYSVKPVETFQDAGGRYCREYQTTVTVGGRKQDAYGTACRQPDGSWELMN